MKARKLLALLIATECILGCFAYGGIAPSEAVMIGGKSLGSISDIVKTATGSDFPEIPKHSLLIYERHQSGNQLRYKSNILTINPDGSLRKRFGDFVDNDSSYMPVKSTTGIVERLDLAISSKRFGNRRNIAYTTSGLNLGGDNPYGRYGYQTLESVGTEDSAKMSNPSHDYWWQEQNQMWGVANLEINGMEDKDVFVLAHGSKMSVSGTLWFKFFTLDRNETGSVSLELLDVDGGDSYQGRGLFHYEYGIRAISMATGDIDGDGYKNEIAFIHNANPYIDIYVYKVVKSGNKLKVTELHKECIHYGVTDWGQDQPWMQASVAAVTGDFNGDGKDEAAFICKTHGLVVTDTRIRVVAFDRNSNTWSAQEQTFDTGFAAPLRATKADFDGDGKDEIAMLLFPANNAELFPTLECWYCDHGSIFPKRDEGHRKGGRMSKELLGYSLEDDAYFQSYKFTEDFSITAGPLTGTKGKAKLAEDVAISHINNSRSSVYVFPTKLDSSKNFAGFGDRQRVWNFENSSEGRRGAIITADFANEALMLGDPKHSYDEHDDSYVTILQAMPYHVDNVDINGNLLPDVVNYTCSAFKGDQDNSGEMSVSYTRTDKEKTENDITFNMASSTETIALLGDAGPYVHDYLKFRTMEANIAGNFDERAKAAADTMNTIMDFVTDKIDETTTNSSSSVQGKQSTQVDEALLWDKVVSYSAGQHIWRYKIMNDPLPSWYKLGLKADNRSKDLKPESQERYVTFSMYDDPMRHDLDTASTNTYQARHEEGNLFSYPSGVRQIEGYTANGALAGEQWVAWSKGSGTGTNVTFSKSQTASNSYEDKIQESELNKTVSALASLFGADDPNPLPPYTSHSETFTKTLSTVEAINIKLYGKSNIPGEEAGHRILSMPFVAREGTLKVGHAVELTQNARSRLWGSNSRYKKFPDPALVLPHKYDRMGATIVSTDNNGAAMLMRGLRFYIPDMDQYSDTNLAAGLTYEIRVPIYNASFVKANNFRMRLLYAKASEFNEHAPNTTMNNLKEIQTLNNLSLNGWPDNKSWARFAWKIPENAETDEYVFFVQIDPKINSQEQLVEVHESRLDYSTGAIIDVGGNNEGYFKFHITSMAEVTKKHAKTAAIMAGELKPAKSDGVVYSAFYQKGVGSIGGNVTAATDTWDRTGTISADVKLLGFESDEAPLDTIDFLMVLGVLSEWAEVSQDASAKMEFTITYNGDEYYPEVYLQGVNFKEGVRDQVEERGYPLKDEIENMFAVHRMALVPHTTTRFMMEVAPRAIGFENGAGFEIYVPELAAESVLEEIAISTQEANDEAKSDEDTLDEDTSGNDTSGNDTSGEEEFNKSSVGCNALTGSAVMLGLAALALTRRKTRN